MRLNFCENISALFTAVEDRTLQDIFRLMESFHPKNDMGMIEHPNLM